MGLLRKLLNGKSSSTFSGIFAYAGANLILTMSSSGSVITDYTMGQHIDEPLAMERSGSSSYYEADGLGSVTSLTNSTGVIANSYTYDSFGNRTNLTGTLRNPFQYTGREFDTETGLFYNRARYFDPSAGRFLSEDPIRFRGGLNLYAYTWNDPVLLTDGLGLQGCDAAVYYPPQSPCLPTDPDGPYQGPDGLWYNVPEWQPPSPPAQDSQTVSLPTGLPTVPPPPSPNYQHCPCPSASGPQTPGQQLYLLSQGWRIIDAFEATGVGAGTMVAGVVGGGAICVAFSVETWGVACYFGGIPIAISGATGGYFVMTAGIDEIEELINSWPVGCP